MRYLTLSSILIFVAGIASAFEIEDRASFGEGSQELRIISTADIAFFQPMIASFIAANPDTRVDYVVASSTEVMKAVVEENEAFDVVISSAMDLQTKLANDGLAAQHSSDATELLPDWASWNDMLFAFTQEPAATVISRAGFSGLDIPENRNELINLLRQNTERFEGKIGTYDVRVSGLGYLFATQDARASETYWRLTEVMGRLNARLYCCSSDMIDAVKSGELLVAYNVLGSYAANQQQEEIQIILPTDFTTVMQRIALIPRNAPAPELSRDFVDHLIEQSFGLNPAPLIPSGLDAGWIDGALNRIRIGPGLLVFLDQLKRRAFLLEWESAILQD